MFDYPTVADLTDYIVAQFSDGDEADDAAIGGLHITYICIYIYIYGYTYIHNLYVYMYRCIDV